ncbi:MAG: cytochrome C biogenesis protein [Proteobacteria bacterium HN_bin10]|nr:MAG: cytochrome C biogenesis protein [Proteobacteria bacterium HN_bin10]
MTALTPALALLAGVLTILSPCVLPLAPILASSATAQHRLGPLALAAGLAISFSLVGLFVATIGFAIGLDNEALRLAGGLVMLAVGAVLVVPRFEVAFAGAAAPLSNWANEKTAAFEGNGLWGQTALGALLGLVWSPCVGPTLGAASALAAQGEDLAAVTFVMAAFGLGAGAALAGVGYGARALIGRHRGALNAIGKVGKRFLGWALILVAGLIVTGFDRMIEAVLVEASPAWLTELTTRY